MSHFMSLLYKSEVERAKVVQKSFFTGFVCGIVISVLTISIVVLSK